MDYSDCLNEGKIKINPITKNWVNKELKSAEQFLNEAEGIFKTNYFNSCEIIAYSSMFHSVRALLYSKGFSEKGHYCLFQYVFHLFEDNIALINLLKQANMFRNTRQEIAYDSLDSNIDQAKEAIKTAKELLKLTKKILK